MPWKDRETFAEVTHEESLVANLLGRLEMAMKFEGFTLAEPTWVELPPKRAIEWFKRKGKKLLTRKQFDKLSDTLKQRSFSVAYLEHDYQLSRTHEVLQEAIEQGHSRGKTIKRLKEQFDAWGVTNVSRHHLETVYSTNLLGSYQHGRHEQMSGKLKRMRPYWEYSTAGDERVRPTHAGMNGKVFSADHPVWKTWYPPNGYRCRCTIHPIRRKAAEAAGISTAHPDLTPDSGFAADPGASIKPISTAPKVLPPK